MILPTPSPTPPAPLCPSTPPFPSCGLVHVPRLVDLVVRLVQVDRLARAAFGPQLLAHPRRVVRDHRVCGVEDVGAGTVVLLQADGLRAGEVLEELLHV